MLDILHLFADRFKTHAILKGGLELRLLDCPRYTNDMDYVFVPYSSKNDIRNIVGEALNSLPDVTVDISLHSTCMRCVVERNGIRLQVELNVAKTCPNEPLSTASIARSQNKLPRIIRVMRFDVALAHKLAAWNERRLIRDLYDAVFLSRMIGVMPDMQTLLERLVKSSKVRKKRKHIMASTVEELQTYLISAVSNLSVDEVVEELGYQFAPEEMAGLDKRIRAGIMELSDKLLYKVVSNGKNPI